MNTSSITIISYTEKSIAVIGDTKTYKDSLKNLGGKWNASLTNKETGEKFMGWIFYSSKKKDIQSWIDGGCQDIQNGSVPVSDDRQQSRIQESKQERKQEGKQEGKQENIQAKTIGKNSSSNEDRIRQLEKTVELLLTKLSSLESEVKSLKGKNSQSQTQSQYQTADEFDYEEVVEEIQIPKKRLLR
jgi:hypothetical protein